jgi:tRNA1(Val) A37 N6-methylase TrmN6
MNLIEDFKNKPFIEAVQQFFKKLNIPVNEITTAPAKAFEVIGDNTVNDLIDEVFAYGIVNDAIFEQNETFNNLEEVKSLKSDYDGILLFGITLNERENNLLPTRSQLADIARAFSRTFKFTPITIVFKYGNYIAFANSERTQFKQQWREGDKIGKVSLLRDIDFTNVHSGHERILQNLRISRSGKNAVTNFATLYKYWQEVLSVSILNKTFYNELSNWYFWAIKEVSFPNEPNQIELSLDEDAFAEAIKEHKGKNVIRLLTRILFIWFIKEKGLIPEDIFDEKEIASQFIDGFTPQKPEGMFANGKYSSKYYRAILQNLFFATLNQPQGKREFRSDGKHINATQLMRYKSYLKNPEAFIKLMEDTVPFMNGGLFECLDKPHPTVKGPKGGDLIVYNDGFSDREDNTLVVPDFLFFDADEEVDLSKDYGSPKYKKSKTRGLIAILKSYKFTITENTPIDEDVALDPELLGKVFENLLASYNPETKTTARKQTGSFYTPREIVNYMVEESLIAYLKNELVKEDVGFVELGKKQIALFGNEVKKNQLALEQKIDENPFKDDEEALDLLLHNLVSYSAENPFEGQPEIQKKIIKALDNCKILDPACGSGAYPMGILQKMVHILHKIDPNNTEWKQRQIDKVEKAIDELELLDDTEIKEKSISDLKSQIKDIEASFADNDLDYGRKLYLIENCIYGVDIQPIATQISKLRFFISLVVDQKVNKSKKDFGIRPLPNLETKFVAANTLIGLDKPKEGQFSGSLFDKKEVQKLEKQLKKVRHSLFSIKTPSRKRELREEDKEIREKISSLLAEDFGNETAKLLANWDPYDQNASSPFFDKEWMFDLPKGFDIVIGNPPYVNVEKIDEKTKKILFEQYQTCKGRTDLYIAFIEGLLKQLNNSGYLSFIIPYSFTNQNYGTLLRKLLIEKHFITEIVDTSNYMVFESAVVKNIILSIQKNKTDSKTRIRIVESDKNFLRSVVRNI